MLFRVFNGSSVRTVIAVMAVTWAVMGCGGGGGGGGGNDPTTELTSVSEIPSNSTSAPSTSTPSTSAPAVTLTVTPSLVAFNNSTTLSWISTKVDSCTASGGWSGIKAVSGSQTTGALSFDTTFVLECTGPEGSVSDSATVTVQSGVGTASLSWMPPTNKEDGSVLPDLAGYRVYYGTSSGSYPNSIDVPNPGVTDYLVESLVPGKYFFVVTAYDASGNESVYSKEASKTIN